ncbi:MAG: hypothetical protein M0R74_20320 [Dehalococcoidia bacterium]|nr:hypothetical protein [Dehalococcoidia bacterium]
MANERLIIEDVDMDLLEEQRKDLSEAIDYLATRSLYGLKARPKRDRWVESLRGLENMLNVWSDKRFYAKEVREGN